MAEAFTPSPVLNPAVSHQLLRHPFPGWERIRANPPADLDPWARYHLDDLCRLVDRDLACLAGVAFSTPISAPTTWGVPHCVEVIRALVLEDLAAFRIKLVVLLGDSEGGHES
jgi:hypothetical protein